MQQGSRIADLETQPASVSLNFPTTKACRSMAVLWVRPMVALVAFLGGCAGESEPFEGTAIDKASNAISITDFTDGSGQIHVRVKQCDWVGPAAHPSTSCAVDPGYVLVGGGAEIERNPGGTPLTKGGLLTRSKPNADILTWLASSKDHAFSDPHRLRAYAIGMKLQRANGTFLTTNDLLGQMYRFVQTSEEIANHPFAVADIRGSFSFQEGDVMLGGGAEALGTFGGGQLLIASTPLTATGWLVAAKDHGVSDPSFVEASVIGIRRCPATWGRCFVTGIFPGAQAAVGNGYHSMTRTIGPPFATTSVGGRSEYDGPGRLITDLFPVMSPNGGSTVASKDHWFADTGSLQARVVGVSVQ